MRRLRRDARDVRVEIELVSGGREVLNRATLVTAPEAALRLLTVSTVLVAVTLVLLRL
jgi:hypothetical protein